MNIKKRNHSISWWNIKSHLIELHDKIICYKIKTVIQFGPDKCVWNEKGYIPMYIMLSYQSLYAATWSFNVSRTPNRKHIANVEYLKYTTKLQNVQDLIKLRIRNYFASLFHILQASNALWLHIHVKVLQPMLNWQSLKWSSVGKQK